MASRRTTHRSSKGIKLYAVRDKKGQTKDIQTYKKAHAKDAKRKSGREMMERTAERFSDAMKRLADIPEAVKKSDAIDVALRNNRDIPICADCAEKHGAVWPKGHLATRNSGIICSGCGLETTVCPMSDWEWPGRDGRRMREKREI